MKQAETEERREKKVPVTLFAAANSGRGFVSFYDFVFGREEIRRRYLIQGGPGTGKSSLMKAVAAYAEARGKAVEYYRCSSDPDSLDGIILDGQIALLDATAPHTMEAELPGARDEVIHLGAFWDGDRLASRYNEIVSLDALKKHHYTKAYRFLSAAMEVAEANRMLITPLIRKEKMQNAVRRLLKTVPDGDGFSLVPGLRGAIGMRGRVCLDTYERQAERLYVVDDYYGTGTQYLAYAAEEAQRKQCRIRISYQPLMPSLPDAVYFCESGVCLVLGDGEEGEADKHINMKRFVEAERLNERKTEYRINRRLSQALLTSATEALHEAGEYHFRLEAIYRSCMDFDAEEKFIRSFCQKIV